MKKELSKEMMIAVTYNRCSTEEEAQINALKIQVDESREIAENKGWEVVDQYVESQSGTSIVNRAEYQRLLKDMAIDKFDVIVIKSIDRVNRNLGEWRTFCNMAELYNKKIFCYIENRFISYDDSLLDNISAMFAEEFSYQLSKKIKNSHNRRREKKSYTNISRPIFGWDKVGKDCFVINEEEADFYRQAFALAEQGHGFYTIANKMRDLGARSKSGKVISQVHWRKMLYSPRAHGDVILHQSEYNYRTRKRVIQPESEWIINEGVLPAIVTKEYQEHVIAIMQARAEKSKHGNYENRSFKNVGKHKLSGKLICGVCGAVYYRSESTSTAGNLVEWKCSSFLKNGRGENGCSNIHVLENEILSIINDTYKTQYNKIFGKDDNIIKEIMRVVSKALSSNNNVKKLKILEKQLKELRQRQETLMNKLLSGVVDDNLFKSTNSELQSKIDETAKKISDIKTTVTEYNSCEKRLCEIEKFLRDGNVIEKAESKEFLNFVTCITVNQGSTVEIQVNRKAILRVLGIESLEDISKALPDSLFKTTANYQHRTNIVKCRDKDREKILELFKNNPNLMLKEVPAILGKSESYVNSRVRELKKEGVLSYERHQHYGKWLVESNK